jgi:hypothetical protein
MDRKWRTNYAAINTVESIIDFERKYIGDFDNASSELSSLTDIYAVYSVLHIESKDWQLLYSDVCKGYYFVTTESLSTSDGEKNKNASVPEGDEDVVIVAAEEDEDGAGGEDKKQTVYAAMETTDSSVKEKNAVVKQILIPVSSGLMDLTPRILHRMCSLGHRLAQQVILCMVDSNGVVTRCCLYDYIQAPLGTTGEAALASHDP